MPTIIDSIREAFGLQDDGPVTAVSLVTLTCAACGTPFGMESNLNQNRRQDGKSFSCPNGHSNIYGPGTVDKLKQQLALEAKKREQLETRLRARAEDIERLERSRSALRGVITRTKREIAAGRCPVCGETFPVVAEHMAAAHPDYAEESEADPGDEVQR